MLGGFARRHLTGAEGISQLDSGIGQCAHGNSLLIALLSVSVGFAGYCWVAA